MSADTINTKTETEIFGEPVEKGDMVVITGENVPIVIRNEYLTSVKETYFRSASCEYVDRESHGWHKILTIKWVFPISELDDEKWKWHYGGEFVMHTFGKWLEASENLGIGRDADMWDGNFRKVLSRVDDSTAGEISVGEAEILLFCELGRGCKEMLDVGSTYIGLDDFALRIDGYDKQMIENVEAESMSISDNRKTAKVRLIYRRHSGQMLPNILAYCHLSKNIVSFDYKEDSFSGTIDSAELVYGGEDGKTHDAFIELTMTAAQFT